MLLEEILLLSFLACMASAMLTVFGLALPAPAAGVFTDGFWLIGRSVFMALVGALSTMVLCKSRGWVNLLVALLVGLAAAGLAGAILNGLYGAWPVALLPLAAAAAVVGAALYTLRRAPKQDEEDDDA